MPKNELAEKMIDDYQAAFDAQWQEKLTASLKRMFDVTDEEAAAMYREFSIENIEAAIAGGDLKLPRET